MSGFLWGTTQKRLDTAKSSFKALLENLPTHRNRSGSPRSSSAHFIEEALAEFEASASSGQGVASHRVVIVATAGPSGVPGMLERIKALRAQAYRNTSSSDRTRFKGGEFSIVVPGIPQDAAADLTRELRDWLLLGQGWVSTVSASVVRGSNADHGERREYSGTWSINGGSGDADASIETTSGGQHIAWVRIIGSRTTTWVRTLLSADCAEQARCVMKGALNSNFPVLGDPRETVARPLLHDGDSVELVRTERAVSGRIVARDKAVFASGGAVEYALELKAK